MKNFGTALTFLLLLGLFGGFAWLTRNPESPWLEEAEDWPLIGDLASHFRDSYLGPAAARSRRKTSTAGDTPGTAIRDNTRPKAGTPAKPRPSNARSRPPAIVTQTADAKAPDRSTGSATPEINQRVAPESPRGDDLIIPVERIARAMDAGIQASRALEDLPFKINQWTWCLPGSRILAAPEAGAELRERLTSMSYLPVFERRGDWAQVMFRGARGWIDTAWEPPYRRRKSGRGLLRHRYEPVKASDSQRLKRARKILGIDRPSRALGAYTLYTDVEDEDLLGFLYLAAGTAEDAYFARYGRLPSGNPKRSVILFAKEADYRSFSQSGRGLPGTEAGHAGSGVLAFFAEGRNRQSLARTLVHEIGHLLNDRAIARVLPTWLEEGIASDLGSVWVEGSPSDGTMRGLLSFIRNPGMGLLRLAGTHEMGKLPSVAVLMHLDRATFHRNTAWAYTHSAALVRYLLDGEDGRHADAFRLFLKRVAIGHGADPALLLKLLETDAETLDENFRSWLVAEAAAINRRLNPT